MNKVNYDEWFSCLTIREKERIASKGKSKQMHSEFIVCYPLCTTWWNQQDESTKKRIYEHVTDEHGVLLKEFTEGQSYSY